MANRKQLRNEADRLARENEKMEHRLRELRDTLRRQKEDRSANGGYSWQSGERGALREHHKVVLEENQQRRTRGRRMKVLPPNPSDVRSHRAMPTAPTSGRSSGSVRPRPPPSAAESRTSGTTATGVGSGRSSAARSRFAPSVGLENTPTPLDPGHAEFLEALNEWRNGSVEADASSVTAGSSRHAGSRSASTVAAEPVVHPPTPPEGGGRLLDGPAFDEAAAQASFRDAVNQWRTTGDSEPEPASRNWSLPGSLNAVTHGTSTGSENNPETFDVRFKSNLTYLERLMLKKQRASPSASPQRPSTAHSQKDADDEGLVDLDPEDQLEQELLAGRLHRIGLEVHPISSLNASFEAPRPVTVRTVDSAEGEEDPESYIVEEDDGDEPLVEEPDDEESTTAGNNFYPPIHRPRTAAQEPQQLYMGVQESTDDAEGGDVDLNLSLSKARITSFAEQEDLDELETSMREAALVNTQHDAATSIQSLWRGYRARRAAEDLRWERRQTSAATVIQASWRGTLAREFVDNLRQSKHEHDAAIRIQARYRGHLGRRAAEARKVELVQNSALEAAERSLRNATVTKRKAHPLPVPGQQDRIQSLSAGKSRSESHSSF